MSQDRYVHISLCEECCQRTLVIMFYVLLYITYLHFHEAKTINSEMTTFNPFMS